MNWREAPFARVVAALMLGIIAQTAMPALVSPSVLILVLALLFGTLLLTFSRVTAFHQRAYAGIVLLALITVLGFTLAEVQQEKLGARHIGRFLGEENTLVGKVEKVTERERGTQVVLRSSALLRDTGQWQTASGHLMIYLPPDSSGQQILEYGDELLLRGRIGLLKPAPNPYAFDYAAYMALQQVHHQMYVQPGDWQLLGSDPYHPLGLAWRIRSYCLDILRRHLPTNNELAVGAALVLGDKSELSEELRGAYSSTGAMHVLAVSGLHVGLVYMGLGFVLGLLPFRRFKYWPTLKVSILLFGVWTFAFVTGASTSVLRAATMFSFVIVGQSLSRSTNVYNTLAASAFVLLCYDTNFLFSIGFQLSYLAVLGIVYFQPIFYRWWYISNPVGDYLWQLVCVSLAAQLTTLPITLYYFHQFPVYFWLSGLVVVPAATVILGGGIILFFTSWIPGVGWAIGQVLYWVIWVVNSLIFLIEQLPGALMTGIWVGGISAIVLYLILAAIVMAMVQRRAAWVLAGLALVCVTGVLHSVRAWQTSQQKVMTIYHLPKTTAIDFFSGRSLYALLSDTSAAEKAQRTAGNHRLYRGVRHEHLLAVASQIDTSNFLYRHGYAQIHGTRLALLRPGSPPLADSLHIDVIVMSENTDHDIAALHSQHRPDLFVFDGSNRAGKVAAWKRACTELGLAYHDTYEAGALTMQLE